MTGEEKTRMNNLEALANARTEQLRQAVKENQNFGIPLKVSKKKTPPTRKGLEATPTRRGLPAGFLFSD